jgi:hypothetical protein
MKPCQNDSRGRRPVTATLAGLPVDVDENGDRDDREPEKLCGARHGCIIRLHG